MVAFSKPRSIILEEMWIRSFLTEQMGNENPIIHLYTAFAILLEHLGRMLFSFLIYTVRLTLC